MAVATPPSTDLTAVRESDQRRGPAQAGSSAGVLPATRRELAAEVGIVGDATVGLFSPAKRFPTALTDRELKAHTKVAAVYVRLEDGNILQMQQINPQSPDMLIVNGRTGTAIRPARSENLTVGQPPPLFASVEGQTLGIHSRVQEIVMVMNSVVSCAPRDFPLNAFSIDADFRALRERSGSTQQR